MSFQAQKYYAISQPVVVFQQFYTTDENASIYYSERTQAAGSQQFDITYSTLHSAFNRSHITLFKTEEEAKIAAQKAVENKYSDDPRCAIAVYQVTVTAEPAIDTRNQNFWTNFSSIIVHRVCQLVNAIQTTIPDYYPESYSILFKKDSRIIDNVKSLLNDYHSPKYGQFFRLHWNRHHNKTAQRIAHQLPADANDAYNYLLKERQKLIDGYDKLNLDGSFMRRINFTLARLNEHLENNLTAEVEPIEAGFTF